jgi:hypothetical protein
MARRWKEPYSIDKAAALGIHDFEGARVLGPPDARWIYYVEVPGFTFAFFSLDMICEYLAFYSTKLLPSSRRFGASHFSKGAAASVGDGQTRFERLPLWLRKEPRRLQVVRALREALEDFATQD